MKNEYGLDVSYFKDKFSLIMRDIHHYTPQELKNELTKYVSVLEFAIDHKGENK